MDLTLAFSLLFLFVGEVLYVFKSVLGASLLIFSVFMLISLSFLNENPSFCLTFEKGSLFIEFDPISLLLFNEFVALAL